VGSKTCCFNSFTVREINNYGKRKI